MNADDLQKLREQLKRDEGVRRTAYRDQAGNFTIGCGHNLTVPVSDTTIEQMLSDDMAVADAGVATLSWSYKLSPVRYAALVNICFNIGRGGLLKFTKMLGAMQRGDWQKASEELLDSVYARQVGERAERLSRQIRFDEWQ